MSSESTKTISSDTSVITSAVDKQHKEMGIFRLVTSVITLIVGGGVWTFTVDMAAAGANTGAVLTAWAIAAIGYFGLIICFYGLSRLRPELEGGIYSYARAGFGDFAGFISAWAYWISAILCTVSFSALLFESLHSFFPIFNDEGNNIASIIGASLIVWGYTFLVSRGVKDATAVNAVVTISKMLPLFVAIVSLIFLQKFDINIFLDNFWGEPGGLPFPEQVMNATTTTAWVFVGIEGACAMSGRAKKTSDVGRATIISFCCVLCLYLVISILGMGVMPRAELATLETASLAGIMEVAVGPWGAMLINVGIVLSVVGAMLGYTVLIAEVPFEAARLGVFTKNFARVNKKGAPIVTLIVSALVIEAFFVMMLIANGTYQFFYGLSLNLILIPYFLSSLYFLKLLLRDPQSLKGKLKGSRIKWVICGVIGVVYSIFVVYVAELNTIVLMSLFFIPAIAVYVVGKRQRNMSYFSSQRDRVVLAIIILMVILSFVLLATSSL